MADRQRKLNEAANYIVTTLEQVVLRGTELGWETTKEFASLHNIDTQKSYLIIRAAADFWNKHHSKEYRVMFDCDYHGYRWRFHRYTQELKDLCWIAAIRTHSHNERSLNNFSYATGINFDVTKDVKPGTAKIIIPNSGKNYENNIEED